MDRMVLFILKQDLLSYAINNNLIDDAVPVSYTHLSLNYLKNKLNITHEVFKGWKDALIGGEEIYYVCLLYTSRCV